MVVVLKITLALLALASGAVAQSLSITGPSRYAMLENDTYTISWNSRGVDSVSIVAHGERTPLGSDSRGSFDIVIAEGVPAGAGGAKWTIPWIDSITFFVKLKGYDSQGRLVAVDERGYGFRPAVLADKTQDGLYLDLHQRTNQRIYVQKGYKITRAYISTSSQNYLWRPPGRHIQKPHDHAGVFSVLEKKPNHWSTLFNVDMPWAMRYHGGHFIHATSPNLYLYLGQPASSGCNRLTYTDARELYHATPLGTRVEVIGPK